MKSEIGAVRRFVSVTALAAGVFLMARPSHAQGVSQGDIREDLRSYYGGEKTAAWVVLGIGTTAAAGGGYLVTRDSDFARGLGWPLLTMGALEAVGAVFYVFQVNSEIDHYEGLLTDDPAAYKREELDHMHGTTSRFVIYRATELALTLGGAGVATYGFIADKDLWKGIGIGVGAMALPFFVIDTLNQSRAKHYRDRVQQFEPSVSAALSERQLSVSFGGQFE